MPKDKRLEIPAFREAHKEVCNVYREISKSRYVRIPELRIAASSGDPEAVRLLKRYEDAIAARRATTARAGA